MAHAPVKRGRGFHSPLSIVMTLRQMDVAGATVYKGVMGYGAQQRMHKSGFLGLSHDLPIMITVFDKEEKIRAVLPMLDEMVSEGLLVLSDVEVINYSALTPR